VFEADDLTKLSGSEDYDKTNDETFDQLRDLSEHWHVFEVALKVDPVVEGSVLNKGPADDIA
jgi:hypothetical protein